MDVFSDIKLEDATIRSTVDLVKFSPNVFMKKSHVEHALVIRGISTFNSAIYSPAGFYVDDVSYPLHYTQNAGLLDVERIEILKGPKEPFMERTPSRVSSISLPDSPAMSPRQAYQGNMPVITLIVSGQILRSPLLPIRSILAEHFSSIPLTDTPKTYPMEMTGLWTGNTSTDGRPCGGRLIVPRILLLS